MFGKIYGRFFLGQYLGLTHDDEVGTGTLSELIETYDHWETFVRDARQKYEKVQLFTMFDQRRLKMRGGCFVRADMEVKRHVQTIEPCAV